MMQSTIFFAVTRLQSNLKSWRCGVISELMINEQIRDKEVRVIGENGDQLGVMSIKEARQLAEEAELDLVKIAPTAKPPVCKIVDYGKYRYELARKEKDARKKQKTVEPIVFDKCVTITQMASRIGKSLQTIATRIKELQE